MTFPILDLALEFLRIDPSGEDRYAWGPEGFEALATLLDALFAHPSEPGPALDDLLRLACALDLELRSPGAASDLRAVLASDARVLAQLDLESRSRQLRAAASKWSGSGASKQAPAFGAKAPAGTVTAASLLDPGVGGASRVHHRRNR